MSWQRGQGDIKRLLDDGELERVTPSEEVARRLLEQAEAHIGLASKGIDEDPAGALQLSYDGARKACAALLAVQGIRATSRGRHIAVIDAVRAQFGGYGGATELFDRLHRLRRRRNATEYPDADSPTVTGDDARQALNTARTTVDLTSRLIHTGQLQPFVDRQ